MNWRMSRDATLHMRAVGTHHVAYVHDAGENLMMLDSKLASTWRKRSTGARELRLSFLGLRVSLGLVLLVGFH